MRRRRWTLTGLLVVAGCTPPKVPGPVLPVDQDNHRLLTTGLKARANARGRFTDGRNGVHHFNLESTFQIKPPDHLRFTLEHVLGGREVEVGMNADKWWVFVRRPDERYDEGPRGTPVVSLGGTVPIQAEHLMACTGLAALSARLAAPRVTDDRQQLLYIGDDADGRTTVEKEYWLDRYAPRLLRNVVYRDADGRVTLASELDDYRVVSDNGLRLPHRLRLHWPRDDAVMTIHIKRWRLDPDVRADHRAFVSPHDRGERFDHEHIRSD